MPRRLDRSLDIDRRGPLEVPVPPLPRRVDSPRPIPARPPALPSPSRPEVDLAPEIPLDIGVMEIHLNRAPSWRRVLAWLVDGLALGLFTAALIHLAIGGIRVFQSSESGPDWLLEIGAKNYRLIASLAGVTVLATFVYLTLGHALMGATLGKQLLGIRVTARNGLRPTLLRSIVRSVIALVTLFALGLGPLMVLFTRSGRALHDFLAGTYVVKRPPPS